MFSAFYYKKFKDENRKTKFCIRFEREEAKGEGLTVKSQALKQATVDPFNADEQDNPSGPRKQKI